MRCQKLCQGLWKIAAAGMLAALMMAPGLARAQAGGEAVLKPLDVQKLLPASVFFRGQSATTQLRNSGGVKFADGFYVLATLVDTSGYSTDLQSKYQAYFITEVPLTIGGQPLPAGVYGIGFIADSKLAVLDIGAHEVLSIASGEDAAIKRPTPLQIVADPTGGFRLYCGRRYVLFSR